MRAVVKTGPGRGCELLTDQVERGLGAREVRLEVSAASVCGSDAAFYERGDAGGDLGMTFPRTMGHEVTGVVVEVGTAVESPTVGTRVSVETHLHCGECWFCRHEMAHNCARMGLLGVTVDGAFAERVVVPSRSCFALPDDIDTASGALLESAGSAVHGILRSGVEVQGASVLVSGAGPVGLVAAQAAIAMGAREVVAVEPHARRRETAERFGARALGVGEDLVEQAEAQTRLRGGFDLALECSGALPALRAAVDAVRREGTVVSVGLVRDELAVDVAQTLITRGVTLRGSWGRSVWRTWEVLAALVADGRVDLASLVTHRLPISGFPHALDLMREGSGKVLLLPSLPDESAQASVAVGHHVG